MEDEEENKDNTEANWSEHIEEADGQPLSDNEDPEDQIEENKAVLQETLHEHPLPSASHGLKFNINEDDHNIRFEEEQDNSDGLPSSSENRHTN